MDLAAPYPSDAARHTPAAIPFSQGLRLDRFRFSGGLAAAYAAAAGGASGKVMVGELAGDPGDGTPVAVKVMLSDGVSREEALEERNLLLRLRFAADAACNLEAAGAPLLTADRGARHVAYIYGVGHEPSLQALDPVLPAGDAFLIALEPLEQTLKAFVKRCAASGAPPELDVLIRIARDLALALAFAEQQRVVVRSPPPSVAVTHTLPPAWPANCSILTSRPTM